MGFLVGSIGKVSNILLLIMKMFCLFKTFGNVCNLRLNLWVTSFMAYTFHWDNVCLTWCILRTSFH